MLYLGIELLSLGLIVLYLSYQDKKFNLRAGLELFASIGKTIPMLPRTQLRMHNLELTVDHLKRENARLIDLMDNDHRNLEEMQKDFVKSFSSIEGRVSDFDDSLADLYFSQKNYATLKDVQTVVKAVRSLETSLEVRLTPVAPKKGSKAKLKVVKKGK